MDCFSEYIPLVILLILGTWAVETVDAKYYCGCCPCYIPANKCSCYTPEAALDTVPPQLHQCPNNLPQRTVASGSNTAVVCWTEPWASDNKHPSFITPKREGPKPCSSFPEGVYSVKYTATDHSKNSAYCQFSFSVKVTKCPVLSHPLNGRISCDGNSVRGTRCEYSCAKGYQLAPGSGQAVRICRDNGDWSGSEAQCVPLTCPVLQPPLNGEISCEGIFAGCKCTYTCGSGYFMVTGSRHRYCTADRQWTGSEPVCRRAQCPTLNSPPFSSMSCTAGNDIGSVCTYTCTSGYYLMAGSNTRSCLKDAYWSGSAAVCRPVTCDALPMPNNARMVCTGKNYGDRCNFQCLTGYQLASGSASRVCGINGDWSASQPVCSAITCNSLTAAPYSAMQCNGNTYGRKCEYRCNSGYEMISGSESRICGLNGLFSGSMPVCKAIRCQSQDIPSYVEMRCNGDNFGAVCQYQCANGYKAVGGLASRSCEANGRWSGSQLECELIECEPLKGATRGRRQVIGPSTTIICQGDNRFGARCEYRCNQGYQMTSGSKYRVCGLDGQWSGEEAVCTMIICPQLDAPQSGYVRCTTGNQINSKCDYFCNSGYYVSSGSSSRVCGYSGSWSGTEAKCDMIECPAMELSQDSNCLVVCTGNVVGARCVYQVPTNYEMIGRPQRVCELTGRWSGNEPICQEIVTCENLPSPPDGLVHCMALPPVMSPGSSCQYQCHKNYKITAGSQIRVCKNDGQWSGEEVTCTRILVQCQPLINPAYGTIQCTDRSTEGSVCRYACVEGYEILGTQERECLKTGRWTGSEPICIASLVTCPRVKYPINCNVRCCPPPFKTGCKCNYQCVSGYEMVSGSAKRECSHDGSWTGIAPTCSQIASVSQCPSVKQPDNCQMTCCNQKKYSSGCSCQFHCTNGYQLVGPSTITCNSQGKWSSNSPFCTSSIQYAQSQCPSLSSPNNCDLHCSSSKVTTGQHCTYNCKKGYHAVGGSTTRTCGADGHWSGYQPSCQPIYNNRCSQQKKVSHTNMQCSGCQYSGCRCLFKCDPGYEMALGSQTRVCINGQWTGSQPTCQKPTPVPCPVIDPPVNARIRCSCTNMPGCICEYDCELGYTNAGGSKIRTCGTDGQWSGTEPICFPVAATCEPLNAPENGQIQCYGGNFHGARCNYTCDLDFYINSGTYIRHCSNGMWSGSVPTCSSRTHCLPSIFSTKNWNCESDSDGSGCVYGCGESPDENNPTRSKREIEHLENKLTFSDAELDEDEIINI